MSKNPVIFIHGLWMHSSTWIPWMELFHTKGYDSFNPDWPGDGPTVEASRLHPKPMANHGIKEIADHYAKFIETLPARPILIGHSFGGLLVQNLLGRDLGAAGIALDPAPIKGVWQLPFTAIKASLPVLGNPLNYARVISLTFEQFHYAFTNAVPEPEARTLYEKCTVPSPALPLFQVAFSTLNPAAQNKVNTRNATRGPLLITAGEQDHIVPPVLSSAAWKKYRRSPAVTELKTFENRGHSLAIDHGWKEVAEYCLAWLKEKGL